MTQPAPIEVIVCTTLETRRKAMVLRAIDSIHRQTGVRAVPVVVANGGRCDSALMEVLSKRQDIRLKYLPIGSLGGAMRAGRRMVTTPFFSFLDDDDELLPSALGLRLSLIMDADVVATTGYLEKDGRLVTHIPEILEAQRDPLFAITQRCWLSSCGGLFRTDAVTIDYFDEDTSYHEQTLFAFKLAINNLKIRFSEQPTYIVHDTPESLSKSQAKNEASENAIRKMLNYSLPSHVRRSLEKKYRNTLHVLAESYRDQGRTWKAWQYHLRSMRPPFTLHYLAFTRKLIAMFFGG